MTPEERARGERLHAHVEAVMGKAIEWSVDDCSPWAAQWVANETGAEILWPAYSTQDEAEAMMAEAGGLINIWEDMAAKAGLSVCYDPIPPVGSVGVMETSRGQVGGIFAHAGIFCWRAANGVRTIGVGGRTHPFRLADGSFERRELILKAWTV